MEPLLWNQKISTKSIIAVSHGTKDTDNKADDSQPREQDSSRTDDPMWPEWPEVQTQVRVKADVNGTGYT